MLKNEKRLSNILSTSATENIRSAVNVGYQQNEIDVNQNTDEEKVSEDDFESPEHNANKAGSCQEIGETSQGIPMGNIRYGQLMTDFK